MFPSRSMVREGERLEVKKEDWPEMIWPVEVEM